VKTVSLEKQVKQLSRDLKKNPGKAAALGVLVVVMIWFWLPLIYKPEPKPPAAPPTATAAATPAATATTTTSTSAAPTTTPLANEGPKLPWRDVAKWIGQDPLMTASPVTFEERGGTNPFVISPKLVQLAIDNAKKEQEDQQKQDDQNPVATPPVVAATPTDLGLDVASTMIGRQRRSAMINGKVYKEGSAITNKAGLTFTLLEVQPTRVVLERNKQKFELKIKSEKTGDVAKAASS
jgi:hypothetical protein